MVPDRILEEGRRPAKVVERSARIASADARKLEALRRFDCQLVGRLTNLGVEPLHCGQSFEREDEIAGRILDFAIVGSRRYHRRSQGAELGDAFGGAPGLLAIGAPHLHWLGGQFWSRKETEVLALVGHQLEADEDPDRASPLQREKLLETVLGVRLGEGNPVQSQGGGTLEDELWAELAPLREVRMNV